MKTYFKASAILLILLVFGSSAQSIIPEDILADWESQTKNGGTWISTDNTGAYDAWGINFQWGLGKQTLNVQLYAIKDEKNIGTLWTYKVYYHPELKQVIIDQWGSDGSFGHGDIQIKGEGKSESVSVFYNPDGSSFVLKHIQRIEGDTKYSDTFIPDENGEWKKRQSYTWRRESE